MYISKLLEEPIKDCLLAVARVAHAAGTVQGDDAHIFDREWPVVDKAVETVKRAVSSAGLVLQQKQAITAAIGEITRVAPEGATLECMMSVAKKAVTAFGLLRS
jgi:hypothetical protein